MNEFCEVKRPVIVARDAAVWNQTNAEFASEKLGVMPVFQIKPGN